MKNIGKQSCVDVSVVKVTLQTFNSISLVRYLLSRPATNLFPKRHFSGEFFRCTWCQDNFFQGKGFLQKIRPFDLQKLFERIREGVNKFLQNLSKLKLWLTYILKTKYFNSHYGSVAVHAKVCPPHWCTF